MSVPVSAKSALIAETFRGEHRLAMTFIALHFVACGIIAAMTNTWLFWLCVGVPALIFPAWLVRRYPTAFLSRLVVSAACMAFTLLGVQQTCGFMEAHFSFFVMITALAVYRDWRILIFAAALVIIHHVGFTIFNPRAIGFYVRNDAFGAWRHVLSHLTVGLIQVFTLCYLTILLRTREALNAALGSSLDRAQERASRDPLTGLFNRNYLKEVVAELSSEAKAGRREAVICVIDLDHFKVINDSHGHASGDDVLCVVADTLRTQIRPGDCAIRHGGEEFLVFLPNTTIEDGGYFAERIRSHIAGLLIPTVTSRIAVTASIGVAELRQDETFEEVFDRADACLYRAKKKGRNRVEVWDDANCLPPELLSA